MTKKPDPSWLTRSLNRALKPPFTLPPFTPLSPKDVERLVGKPGSDGALAYWLLAALNAPCNPAQTPKQEQRRQAEREKAVAIIARAALDHDEAFFSRWARGRKVLKAIDLRTSLSPKLFLLAAYNLCTQGGRETCQAEVINLALAMLAIANMPEPANRLSPELARAQFDAQIQRLRTTGWKAYARQLGLTFALKAKRGRPKGWRKH
jgi:hypothetical protein